MEKKGLERNVVSLILAIVGIVVVIIILVKVYSLVMQDNEVKSAAKVLDNIIAKTERIEGRGKITVIGVPALVPGNKPTWFLTGWSKGEKGRPSRCFFAKSCICACKIKAPFNAAGIMDIASITFEKTKAEADKKLIEYKQEKAQEICQNSQTGVCRSLDFSSNSIQYPVLFKADDPNSWGSVLQFPDAPFIPLPPLLIEIDVQKSADKTKLTLRSVSEEVKEALLKKP